MKDESNLHPKGRLATALRATGELLAQDFFKLRDDADMVAFSTRFEIEHAPITAKNACFLRHFLPLRKEMVSLLADSYRRYFKLALANPSQVGKAPHQWAWVQLQPAVHEALEWIRQWHMLACDGENQRVRRSASTTVPLISGETVSLSIPIAAELPPLAPWRAPSWLFILFFPATGIRNLKPKNVPDINSEERLSLGHTRLLLKGAKKVFLWELGAAIETVTNEEIANAGAFPAGARDEESEEQKGAKQHWGKGFEGLGQKKVDLSRYMDGAELTEKQYQAFSLRFEYELGLVEVASRMGINHKTADEHIKAADKKIKETQSNERNKARRMKDSDD